MDTQASIVGKQECNKVRTLTIVLNLEPIREYA